MCVLECAINTSTNSLFGHDWMISDEGGSPLMSTYEGYWGGEGRYPCHGRRYDINETKWWSGLQRMYVEGINIFKESIPVTYDHSLRRTWLSPSSIVHWPYFGNQIRVSSSEYRHRTLGIQFSIPSTKPANHKSQTRLGPCAHFSLSSNLSASCLLGVLTRFKPSGHSSQNLATEFASRDAPQPGCWWPADTGWQILQRLEWEMETLTWAREDKIEYS